MKFRLPKRKNVHKTNDEDPIYFYYLPIIGYIYKKRLANTLALMNNRGGRILDIGYGSGVLFPELDRDATELYGLETHGKENLVYQMLEKEKINSEKIILKSGSILGMPFQDGRFDTILAISVMEHIKELDKAMFEIKRVLKPGGKAILSFPVRNKMTDAFYRMVGFNPRHIHPSSHIDIIKVAKKFFVVEKTLIFPDIKNIDRALYCSICCAKK